jgi:protein-tyrosine sulfotransferase
LQLRQDWRNEEERARLVQGGIYDDIIDNSMAAFIVELIAKHGYPAKVRQDMGFAEQFLNAGNFNH